MDIHININGKYKHIYLQNGFVENLREKYRFYIHKHNEIVKKLGFYVTPLTFTQFTKDYIETIINEQNIKTIEELKRKIKK